MDVKTASRPFFAVTMIAIGAMGLVDGSFAPIWAPVPETLPGRQALAILSNLVAVGAGIGLLTRRWASSAALGLLGYLLVWTLAFKLKFIIRAPLEEVSYQSNGENWVLIAAAWILYADAGGRNFLTSPKGLRIAFVLYGLALIAFGLSHFFYLQMTAPLIPGWLPGPANFWAYLTGVCYLAAGAAIVTGLQVRLAAMLVAVQITGITLLVWGPMVLTGEFSSMHWQETIVSWALTAGAWVLASGWRPAKAA